MTAQSVDAVKKLRERTGAGMMDCKAALQESGGDIEKAIDFLRKKGVAQAAKRAGREAREGLIAVRINGTKAALIETNCETDFVARTDDFKNLAQLVLDEVWSSGDASLKTSQKISGKVAELSGKIGEKILVRRAKVLQAGQGNLFSYVHSNNRLGVVIEIEASKPESKKNASLESLGKDLSMQVAAASPLCVSREEVPADVLEREKAIYREEIKGKPENIVEKILQGKLEKFYKTHCLLEQPFIKDDKVSIKQLLEQTSKSLQDTIKINQFVRFQLGESVSK